MYVPNALRPDFVHLNVHSAWSLLSGTECLEVLAARASAMGYPALALTDSDGAYGLPAFQVCCEAVDLKALHGAELSDAPRSGGTARAILLAANDRGHANLCRLVTHRRLDERFALVDELPRHAEGLVVLTDDADLLTDLADAFDAEHLYAEIIAHGDKAARPVLLERAAHLGRHAVGTHRVFLDRPTRHPLHRLLLAIKHLRFWHEVVPGASGRDGKPMDLSPPDAWLMPPREAIKAFRHIEGAARRTVEIAERLTYRFRKPDKPRLPALDPESLGVRTEGMRPAVIQRALADAAYGKLASRCIEGARRRYGTIRADVLQRLERELGVIQDKGFSDYFLIVHGLVRFARERGIPAVGRGSAANSIVAYSLGITSVDPLRYDLPFERFLSPARMDCPDIDLDLDWRGRDDVINHAYETYGDDRVAMISTHVTFQARSAVREVAKAFGFSKRQIDPIAGHLPWRLVSPLGSEPPDAPPADPDFESRSASGAGWGRPHPKIHDERIFDQGGRDLDDLPPEVLRHTRGGEEGRRWTRVLRAAAALDGLPRHLGIHVGGIVIGDGPLADSVPLERAAKGLVVTQYDMHGVEATGLVKIDLLGNRALAVIADVVRQTMPEAAAPEGEEAALVPRAEEQTGPLTRAATGLDSVPEEDPGAARLLREGRTLGCFQVESPGMRNLVVRMGAESQDDAMVALSLIRPGPAGSGMKDAYVRRRRGEEAVPALHPVVDQLFTRTHGVMLYQEDTLRVAAAVAGFDLGQADQLRRALSKKRTPEDLPRMEAEFRAGAAVRGIPPDVIETVWTDIQRFSAYAYNKAHAATYSRISWQGLYLKARHPAEYVAAVIRNGGGFYAPRAYVEEARRMGCRVALPCINHARIGPEGQDGVLRLGFDQIKGLRRKTPKMIVTVREAGGAFVSPADLLLRTTLEKHEVERLILAGCLDVFDRPRGELLWLMALDFERFQKARREQIERSTLFGASTWLPPPRSVPVPPTYSAKELLEMEVETLGLTATCHPAELWQDAAEEAGAIPTTALAEHTDEIVRIAGWVVTDRRVRVRGREQDPVRTDAKNDLQARYHRGRHMKFLMLEDLEGTCEVTVFPDTYERVGHLLHDAGPYLVTGRVREDHGAITLDARDVTRLGIPG